MSHTFLCVTCYFKGAEFLTACKEAGNQVFLVTSRKLEHDPWPRESIDDIFYLDEDENGLWKNEDLILGLAHLMRSVKIDRIVALDDFDVERAALLRETFRVAGMGQTTARYFRDKLAMRMKARDAGILVPNFSGLFNDAEINEFANQKEAPWFIKPRGEASATGIKKVHNREELWQVVNELGDKRHEYLIEAYIAGDVFHVDALTYQGKTLFTRCSRYLDPPYDVAHGGGVFRTTVLESSSTEHEELLEVNNRLLSSFGMQDNPSHTEYIRNNDQYYFLETSSRVGGAHIAEMVEAASGINLWHEWARLESALLRDETYELPDQSDQIAGTIISLCRQETPDTSSFNDPEIWWRMDKKYHIGFILQSKDPQRISNLLENYAARIKSDFHAAAPAPERSSH